MNEFILCVLDRDNKTKEELEINAVAADIAAAGTRAVWLSDGTAASDAAAADVAYYADVAANAAKGTYDDDINHFLHEYFSITGENRCDYEKAIKENKG